MKEKALHRIMKHFWEQTYVRYEKPERWYSHGWTQKEIDIDEAKNNFEYTFEIHIGKDIIRIGEDHIHKVYPPMDLRRILANRYAIEHTGTVYEFWNVFKQLYQYKYLSKIKKKKYRRRGMLFKEVIGDEVQ
jgi:hypothetical protein